MSGQKLKTFAHKRICENPLAGVSLSPDPVGHDLHPALAHSPGRIMRSVVLDYLKRRRPGVFMYSLFPRGESEFPLGADRFCAEDIEMEPARQI